MRKLKIVTLWLLVGISLYNDYVSPSFIKPLKNSIELINYKNYE